MPTFNADLYLERAILSIFANLKKTSVELCVSDNFSTDKTISILKKYQKKFNIKFIQKKDNGVGEALNNAFELATGDIFGWLDADDEYKNGTLDYVSNYFDKNKNSNFIYGLVDIIDDKSKVTGQFRIEEFDKKKWLNEWHHIVFNAMFFRRKVPKNVGFMNDLGNDLHFYLRVAKKYKLEMINKKFSNYRLHFNSISLGESERVKQIRFQRTFEDALLVLRYGGSIFSPRFLTFIAILHGKYKDSLLLKFMHKFYIFRFLGYVYRKSISQVGSKYYFLNLLKNLIYEISCKLLIFLKRVISWSHRALKRLISWPYIVLKRVISWSYRALKRIV